MSDVAENARSYLTANPGGIIPPDKVAEISGGVERSSLLRALIPLAAEYAQPQISGYKVGAVGLGQSGAILIGANFEFSDNTLAQTVHAEQCLVANAAGAGEQALTHIAISAPPCGHCRQFLNELHNASTLKILIPDHKATKLAEFLPRSFGPPDLGIEGGLMDSQLFPLTVPEPVSDLGRTASRAAASSYAPYSKSPGGVALKLGDGSVFTGSYLENAAFNPSLPPLQAALATLVVCGRKPADVVSVAAAQLSGTPVNHFGGAREELRRICPAAELEFVQLISGERV